MYEYITREADLKEVQSYLLDYQKQKKVSRIAVDVETSTNFEGYFPKPIILPGGIRMSEVETLQIGLDPEISDTQFILNIRKLGYECINPYFGKIIETSLNIGHNYKYDIGYLMRYFSIFPRTLRDTMLIVKRLRAGDRFDASLGNCYRKYLDYGWFISQTGKSFKEYEAYKKEMQVSDWTKPLSPEQLQYAADDVRLIFYLYSSITAELDKFVGRYKRKGIYDVIKLESKLIPEVSLMEIRGAELDKEYYNQGIIKYLENKYKEAMRVVGDFFTIEKSKGRGKNKVTYTEPININSPKQVPESLAKVGIKVDNTQEKTLKRALFDIGPEHPYYDALRSIMRAKKASSLLSKFGEKILKLVYPDGKLHYGIFQEGTKTGRLSASGPNVMQFPMRDFLFGEISSGELFRRAITVGIGYRLVVTDLSQIEPRMTAEVTRDIALIRELNKDKADLHGLTAQLVLGLAEPPPKGDFRRDFIGKTINLGLSYGMGAEKLARFAFDETIESDNPIHWTVEEAQSYRDAYYEMFTGIQDEMNAVARRVQQALQPFDSLESFKGRKVLYMEFTKLGRNEGWYLTQLQEMLARNEPEKLHRKYVVEREIVVTDEYGEPLKDSEGKVITKKVQSKWNEFNKTLNRIAREAYNFKIQGASADLFKMAMVEMSRRFRKEIPDYDPFVEGILMPVHDEVVVKAREDRAELFQRIVNESMVSEGRKLISVVPIKVSSAIGNNWAECKD